MRGDDIAIIGGAALLPDADTLDALHDNLATGRDSVGQPTGERALHTGGTAGTEYLPMAYLPRIDLFDHRFFGLPRREAELMDPHQRLVLQLAHQAIENAGYAPGALRGSRTAVVIGCARSDYHTLYEDEDPQQLLGALGASLAARIGYLLDLTGPALVTDTACSSGLVAVAQAVALLRSGGADLAIAGGITVRPVLFPRDGHNPLRGVESAEGRCRPFDERATGTVGGEGGGVVVLKPLRDALAAGDGVQAVLRGVSVNHNGFRMASMSAPSQLAQAEVVADAWRDAGVDPRTIGFVECHGSATPLGDVVEVDALCRAFRDAGVDTPHCAIGSIKGNIGHLDTASGVAGLFKAMLSVRRGVLYPTAHFTAPNPLIDFEGPVFVNPAERAWRPPDGAPRRAGVSSFGLSGTNVHVVLEQPPPAAEPAAADGPELLTVSAKSPSALRRYRDRLADFLDDTGHGLRAVAHAMNRGRDDHPWRLAVVGADNAAAAKALRSASIPDEPAPDAPPVVLLCSGDTEIPAEPAQPDTSAGSHQPDTSAGPDQPDTPAGRLVAATVRAYELARSYGVPDAHLVGSGAGNLAVRVARGELSLADALVAARGMTPSVEVDRDRLADAVRRFVRDGAVLVELGADGGVLAREIHRLAPALACVPFPGGDPLERLAALYRLGVAPDWDRYYAGAAIPRVEAPTYPFDPIRCWCRPPGVGPPIPAEIPAPPAPRTDADTERRVAAVWEQVLGAGGLGPDADYFALGGTSIAAIGMLRSLERDFGVELTFGDLYAHPTVRALAARVLDLTGAGPHDGEHRTIVPVPRGGPLPLSFGQEQLWYLERLNPDSPLYNLPHDLRLTGPMDEAALVGAVRDLVARHEVLRTCLPSDDEGMPYVRVRTEEHEVPLVDLAGLPETERHRAARRLVDEEAVRPFSLADGPLVRTTLIRLAPDDHVLLWTYHHVVFDGWSPTAFFRDLTELYRARLAGRPPDLPGLPVQYADYAAWQRDWLSGDRLARGLEFWETELAGLNQPELPLDHPRPPVQTYRGALAEFLVDEALADRVRRFSKRSGVTTFVTMLAVVDALLYRWAGRTDVVVGVGTSGRTNPATHDLIGYFNNLPPFRTRVDGDLSFAELVRRCATTVAGVLDHEDVPLEKIVARVCGRRAADRHPLFDVAYTYQNVPQDTAMLADLECRQYLEHTIVGIAPGTAKFDLSFGVIDQDTGPMAGYVEYAVALFEPDTMRRLADRLPAIVESAMADPTRRVDDLDPDPLLVDAFEACAARQPDHPAVVDRHGTHTYRDVNRLANRVARRLVEAGIGPDSPVPVVVDRGVALVVGWLAVAKAGGAYVPIDPAAPPARVDDLVSGVGARVVLTARDLAGGPVTAADDENPPRRTEPANLAYIGYTSGSTGTPQGCAIEHHNLARTVRWYRAEAGITGADRLLQAVSPAFDAATLEVWTALGGGATLCAPPTIHEEPGRLLRWLADHEVTVAFLPTPLAEIVLTDTEWPADLRLRVLATGGDRLRFRPPPDAPFRVLNIYGPTECTIAATAGYVDPTPANTAPDIGRPMTDVYLLDPDHRTVPDGQWGEVHVGGGQVGRGYHGRPGLTAARFLPDPFAERPGARMYRTGDLARRRGDGTLEFGGRIDDQVQVRGQRVEPAEIERTLAGHPLVSAALVVPTTARSGSVRLVAHVTGRVADGAELIDWAARRLPGYLVPSDVVVRDRLPTTPSGKYDRRSLSQMPVPMAAGPRENGSLRGPDAEAVLTGICADLLAVDSVSAKDNFFGIGGDSILGVRVAARAAKAGVHFTPQQLLQCRSIGELAAIAMVSTVDSVLPASAPVVTAGPAPAGPLPLTPIMRCFLERTPDSIGSFVEVQALEADPAVRGDAVRAAVGQLLTLHEALRYRFRRNDIGWRVECADVAEGDVVDTRVLPPLTEADELALVAADCETMKSEIDIGRGPALRVRYYDRGRHRSGLIVLLVHHFVFDNMSIVVLLDDLDALLADHIAGRAVPASARPAAWRDWSTHLAAMAQSDDLAGELGYWTAMLRAGSRDIPTRPAGAGAGGIVLRSVDPPHVADVLTASAAAGREAAMCAAACGLARWRSTTSACVMAEGDATPNVYRPGGRGPSVGWFTSLHPVVLPVAAGATVPDCLPAAADAMRSVPNDGVGYGILRHLSPNFPAVAEFRALPEPDAIVLHGPSDTAAFDSGVGLLRVRWDLAVNLKRPVASWFPLIISTAVRDGSLRLALASVASYGEAELTALADAIVAAFTELTG